MSILNSHKKNLFPEDFFDTNKEKTNESKSKHPQIITKENIKKKCVITCSEIKEEIEESLTESHNIHEASTSNSSNNNNIVLTPVSKNKNINNRYENCENPKEKIFLFGNFDDDSNDFKKTAHFFENNNNNNNIFNNNNDFNNININNKLINKFDVNNNNINNNNYKENLNIKKTSNNCKTPTQNKKKINFNNNNNNNNNNNKINRNNLTKKIPHPITTSTPRNINNNNNNNINNNNNNKITAKKTLEKKNSFSYKKRPKSSKVILNNNLKIKLTHKKVENEFNNVLTIIPKELLSDPEVKDKFNKIIKNINELKKVVSDKKEKK
jgi:hypothetical protein